MSLPEPVDVWDHVVDVLLDWRNDRYTRVNNDAVDNAITGVKALKAQSPAPSEIKATRDGTIVLVWRSDLHDMFATYDSVKGKIVVRPSKDIT